MKITLFGCTDITKIIAEFLDNNGYEISAIVTSPEIFSISYSKEGVKNFRYVDLKPWADRKNIPIFLYVKPTQLISEIKKLKISSDFAIVAGWYYMLPKNIRNIFPKGCAGFHASLLPKLRGGAPLNWSILLGYKETGVSFYELSTGVDDGMLYDQKKFAIKEDDYIEDLIFKSHQAIINILKTTLPLIENGTISPSVQKGEPSFGEQRCPKDSQIIWDKPKEDILRLIRASSKPYSGSYSFLNEEKIKIWKATDSKINLFFNPGQIYFDETNIYVGCGNFSSIKILEADKKEILRKSNYASFKRKDE